MDMFRFINIGFGNLVSADKLVAVVAPDSAPVKRIVQEAKQNGLLIVQKIGVIRNAVRNRVNVFKQSQAAVVSADPE